MTVYAGSKPLTNQNLVAAYDAANVRSYPGSGSTWYNLISRNPNLTLTATTFEKNSTNPGSIYFNGSASASSTGAADYNISGDFTIESICYYPLSTNSDNTYRYLWNVYQDSSNYINLPKWRSGIGNGWNLDYCSAGSRYIITTSTTAGSPNAAATYGTIYDVQGKWSYVVVTVNSHVMTMYINGRSVGSVNLNSGNRWSANSSIYLGDWISGGNPMLGHCSLFRLYRKGFNSQNILDSWDTVRSRVEFAPAP